ncbi:MAG: TetR/AcrR family transcriptional regulator [Acidimicrobiales bacterium]|jgi:AcrR family transcriptional regulator
MSSITDLKRAAISVIAAEGYANATTRAIADAAGIKKATVYHYIQSKESLLFAIIEDFQATGENIIEVVGGSGGTASERLQLLIRLHVGAMVADPLMSMVLARELQSLEGDFRERAMRRRDLYQNFIVEVIREGQHQAQFRQCIDAKIFAIGILSVMNTLHEWYDPAGDLKPEDVATTLCDNFIHGLVDH